MKRGWKCVIDGHPEHVMHSVLTLEVIPDYHGPCGLIPRWWNWSWDAIRYRNFQWFG